MPKFSTFTIYEKEVRIFIDAFKDQDAININELSEWMYSSGLSVYVQSQSALHRSFVTECQKIYGHRPLISIYHTQGQHYTGLVAVQDALIQKFAGDVSSVTSVSAKENIIRNFNMFLLPAIAAHSQFIQIESEIASEFNAFMDSKGELPPIESLEKVIVLFEEKQKEFPKLEDDFKYKLTLMREYLELMKKSPALAVPHAKAADQFFNQPTDTAIKTEPGRSEHRIG